MNISDNFDVIPFQALDGFPLNFWRYKHSSRTKCPVILVHGAGVRCNLFNSPNEINIVKALAAQGYDVWLENWRASMEVPFNNWDLDMVAKYDHPAAVQTICNITGYEKIKAIIHCQGSTSFMISAILGLVPQVEVILSNAVSLFPTVPKFSVFKLNYVAPFLSMFSDRLDARWGIKAPSLFAKMLKVGVSFSHPENDTMVGKFVSLMYGTGFPALWELDNLSDETKQWIQGEFGEISLHFFKHITQCVNQGVLAPFQNKKITYIDTPPQTDARFVFFAGELNKCFTSEGQVKTFNYFDGITPHKHKLYLYPTYSHLDIFFGKEAHIDIFPTMIAELDN
jgi:hypothetical protein